MQLQTSALAPLFDKTDVYDRRINLEDYADKKVLLGFFRHAGCPFCNLRVHTLTKVHEELKSQGLEMIFFFESKKNVILRSTFHQEVSPIPIISDPDKEVYEKYGLEPSLGKSVISHVTSFVQTALKANKTGVPIHPMADGESFNTMPAEFLLGEGLKIKDLHYSNRLNDRMDVGRVYDFAKSS